MSSSSIVSLGCLFLFWKTQQLANKHALSGEEDSLENDPLKFNAWKTFLFAPSILGIIKFMLYLKGDSDLPSRAWKHILRTHPSNYDLLRSAYVSGLITYFGIGLPNLALDYLQWPHWLYKHKIQKDAEVDYAVMLPKLFMTLAQNLSGPVVLALILPEGPRERICELAVDKLFNVSAELPSFWSVVRNYWAFCMTYDIIFFFSHWALHTKTLYSRIHKKHHEWKSPTALASAYAHPVEHVLSNVAPAALLLAVSNKKHHILSFLFYVHVGLVYALLEHCGYEFVDTSAAHDIHHSTFTSNFGVTGLFDRIYGTRALHVRKKKAKEEQEAKTS